MEWVFAGLVLALFAYEGVALYSKREGDTISEIVWKCSRNPLIPFLAGLLCGHFFWPRG